MKYLIIVSLALISCCQTKQILNSQEKKYFVERIEILDDWNIIYLSYNKSMYKVISKKEKNMRCEEELEIHKSYNFSLNSSIPKTIEINGEIIQRTNYLEVTCYYYDQKTKICLEPENGIYDLYYAENLKGLCINNS